MIILAESLDGGPLGSVSFPADQSASIIVPKSCVLNTLRATESLVTLHDGEGLLLLVEKGIKCNQFLVLTRNLAKMAPDMLRVFFLCRCTSKLDAQTAPLEKLKIEEPES